MSFTRLPALIFAAAVAFSALPAATSATAATAGTPVKSVPAVKNDVVNVRVCWRRIGPYRLQSQAYRIRRIAQARGYRTSNVYGIGGIVTRYSFRRYYFNVYYRC